jgi:hypothetical protein
METGSFYLGRVIKIAIDQQKLLDALLTSLPITVGKFRWAIIDVQDRRQEEFPYFFAKLAKYSKDGQVSLVEESQKTEVSANAPNLLVASSPFVYLPEFSGIAYLHVWNEIQDDVFPRRFKAIVEESLGKFFVDCHIEPLADYQRFITKLKEIDVIDKISATVHPPNPLFGRLWKPLNDYLKKRNATEVRVREAAAAGGLKTDLALTVTQLVEHPDEAPTIELSITDSAVLMAADGYGHGSISGTQNGEKVLIRTQDAQKSFQFPKDPDSLALASEARKHFERVSRERHMEHPNE